MGPRSKQEYVEAIYLRYKHALKQEKTAILDEFCTVCKYHRKHAIRVLRDFKRCSLFIFQQFTFKKLLTPHFF